MRSKSKKKKKAAYRRGEKLTIFFKKGTLVMLAIVFTALGVLGVKHLTQQFYVREIVVTGNYHLDEKDIIDSSAITGGEPLLHISFKEVEAKLRENPWIKQVVMRKHFPGTLLINVEEALPRALLSLDKQMYLLDEDGEILERVKDKTTPFLPVIKEIKPENRKGITEALKLIHALSEKNNLVNRESIEIGLESYGLTMNIDGEFIKVGYGNYSKKFDRWVELEPEIRRREVPVKYVDLRFKDSVIVKPIKTEKRKKSS